MVVEHLLQSLASGNLLQPQLGRGGDQADISGCCLKISCCQFCSDLFNGLYSPEEKKFSWLAAQFKKTKFHKNILGLHSSIN